MRLTNTHQRHTDGGNGSPRRTYHHADQGAKQTAAHQEPLRLKDLHTIVDHGGHNARYHPRTTDGTNQ